MASDDCERISSSEISTQDLVNPKPNGQNGNLFSSPSSVYGTLDDEKSISILTSDIENLLKALEEAYSNRSPFLRTEEDLSKKLAKMKIIVLSMEKKLAALNSSRDLNVNIGDLDYSYGAYSLAHAGLAVQYERFQKELDDIKKRSLLAPEKKLSNLQTPSSSSSRLTNNGYNIVSRRDSHITDVYNYILEDQDSRLNQLQKILALNKEAGTVIGQELDSHVKIIDETSEAASFLQRHMDEGNSSLKKYDIDDGFYSKFSMCKLSLNNIICRCSIDKYLEELRLFQEEDLKYINTPSGIHFSETY